MAVITFYKTNFRGPSLFEILMFYYNALTHLHLASQKKGHKQAVQTQLRRRRIVCKYFIIIRIKY